MRSMRGGFVFRNGGPSLSEGTLRPESQEHDQQRSRGKESAKLLDTDNTVELLSNVYSIQKDKKSKKIRNQQNVDSLGSSSSHSVNSNKMSQLSVSFLCLKLSSHCQI